MSGYHHGMFSPGKFSGWAWIGVGISLNCLGADLNPQVLATAGVVWVGGHSVVRGESLEGGQVIRSGPQSEIRLHYREGVDLEVRASSQYRLGIASQSGENVSGELMYGEIRVNVSQRYGPQRKFSKTAYGPKKVYVLRTPLGVIGLGDLGRMDPQALGGQMQVEVRRFPNGKSEIHLQVKEGKAWVARWASEIETPTSQGVLAGQELRWGKFPPLEASP